MRAAWALGAPLAAVLAFFFVFPSFAPKNYVFDPAVLQSIAQESIGKNHTSVSALIHDVHQLLAERYPDSIEAALDEQQWIFNNAGGAMGSMVVLYASLTEYVIFFGTALGTEGHTGRFLATDFFTILYGEQWAYAAGSLDRETYHPGDQHVLQFYEAKQYKMPEACWALEYARGNIPSMLPFGVHDAFFSTLDFVSLGQTVVVSGKAMLGNLIKGRL